MWWQIARAQGGVITNAQLVAAGESPNAIWRMKRSGELIRLAQGVYLCGGAPLTFRARLWAAVLSTEGSLSRTTAGRIWGVYEDESDSLIHITLPHARRVAMPNGVSVHREVIPPPEVRHRSELPVTSRRWTVLDLLATLPYSRASVLADRAVQRGWIAQRDCSDRLAALPKRPGNTQLRRLASMMGDGAAAESERVLHRLLRRGGVTGWRPNYEVWAGGELVGVLDVALPARRIAIEVDGMAHHVDVDRFRRDRARQNALVALGWTVLRFTWADLTERPGYVIATIRRLAA